MNAKDPKGYYAILQVEPTSSAPQIKAAYKRRAMELHPDRNSAPSATRDFQLLTEAHRILTNPAARANYDTSAVATDTDTVGTRASVPEPIVCSACGKVTAQPRYVIFYYVISFILVTTRTPVQGIFCSRCAEWKGLRAAVITWLFGWWGFPWGPFYSLDAILKNLVGGTKPYEINARLAAHQAMVFAVLGKMQVARAIALDAAALARKVKPKNLSVRLRRFFGKEVDDDGSRLRKEIADLLGKL